MTFDLFSKRGKPLPDVFTYDELPLKFRQQVLFIWNRIFADPSEGQRLRSNLQVPLSMDLRSVWEIVCEEHGCPYLIRDPREPEDDLCRALIELDETDIVLDIIETSFRFILGLKDEGTDQGPGKAIATLNYRFRENGLGYEFDQNAGKLIRIDSTLVHNKIVKPALALLADPRFKAANHEMLIAFDDYKKGDYGDCLTKCCSAFESTMKIVCAENGWPYDPNRDTAGQLVQKMVKHGNLPSFFDQPLALIGTMRNKLSSAHGGGQTPRGVPEEQARYALHSTAAAILLVASLA